MKSIRWRLVIFYVLLVIIVMIVSGTLIVTMLKNDAYNKLANELKGSVRTIILEIDKTASDEEIKQSLINNIEGLSSIQRDKQIFLLDDEGYELYPTTKSEKNISSVVMAAINGVVSNDIGGYKAKERGQVINYREYAEPVPNKNNEVAFIIYARMSTEQVEQNLEDTIFIILVSILIALVLATVIGAVLATTLTKPITALTSRAREMAQGKLDTTIEVKSDDEIGQLTQNFNIMAKALNKTLSDMIGEKNKLETVFSHMTDGILVFDKDGKLIHTNRAANQLFDAHKINSFNEMFKEFIDIKYNELIKKVHKDITQHIININNKFYNMCFAPYKAFNDEYMGVICVIQDITQHKKLEEMQKEFVANVSHELRTPITTIKSYTETLLEGAMEDRETSKNFLEVINHESDRMTNLVQDLLDLSRLDNKQTKFKMKYMNLTHVIEQSVSKYKIHANKKKQKMNYHKPNKEYKIYGDPERIEQVIKNIISNAVKYSPDGAEIIIQVFKEDNYINVAIKDTGMGISKDDADRIFDRFYRVDKARSREMGGTGLGLAIAKEIMEYHGGSITVESELGKGTCFYLKFPS